MPATNGDIQIIQWARTLINSNNQAVPGYEIHFQWRQKGDYVASLPVEGYTADRGLAAIHAVIDPIADTYSAFPTSP